MNDQFLHRLRQPPPPEFAKRLRAKLRRQEVATTRTSRPYLVRGFVLALAISGSALAAALIVARGVPVVIREIIGWPADVTTTARETSAPDSLRPRGSAQTPEIPREEMPAQSPSNAFAQHPSAGSAGHVANDGAQSTAQQAYSPAPIGRAPSVGDGSVVSTQREIIDIVATSLAYQPMKEVIERWRADRSSREPQLRKLDDDRALAALCGASTAQRPEIAITSRRIARTELRVCDRNSVKILEGKLGHRAIVLTAARTSTPLRLSPRDVYLALAKEIPDPADPAQSITNDPWIWNNINPALEQRWIRIFGPPRDSSIRDLFTERLLEVGCDSVAEIRALRITDPQRHAALCRTVRADGVYIETEETDTLITQKLWAEPGALAVLDYRYYERNKSDLAGSLLEGVEPSPATIASGEYTAAYTLYVYVNRTQAIPNQVVRRFLLESLDERTTNVLYPLRKDLIPIEAAERQAMRNNALQLRELTL